MHLRKLRREDAPAMLAWMHDPSVVAQMGTNFAAKTMDDCLAFIADSEKNAAFVHFAVADDNDHYMGTVSLKHIDFRRQCGEFAITVCAQAMGKGYAHFAMEEILRYGFQQLGLRQIYWYVSPLNTRAVRFYDKHGYPRLEQIPVHFTADMTREQIDSMLWYLVENK